MAKIMTNYGNEGECMQGTNIVRDVVLFSIAVALNAIQGGIAMAQAPAAENSLAEIVVTAQKRKENLQDVPISISVATADTMQKAGISSTNDLMGVTPAVNVTRVTQSPLVFIRGVGTENSTTGEEGSNPIYVDGFYNPSLAGSVFSFNNVERIEVLKGPQGTLFGRNATGGAINVITKDPSSTPAASGSIGYGNHQTVETSAYLTGGLADHLAADFAGYYTNQNQGWGTNLTTGKQVDKSREVALRSKLQYRDDRTEATLGADFSHSNSDYAIATEPVPGAFTPGLLQTYTGNPYNIRENVRPGGFVDQWGVNLRVAHELDAVQLVSMSSYRRIRANFALDQDGSSLPLVDADFFSTTQVVTQEAQVQSLPSSKIQWILGGFYLHSKAESNPLLLSGLAYAAVGGSDARYGTGVTDSAAGYAQATVPLGAYTDITGGVRYTHDKKSLDFVELLGTETTPTLTKQASKDWSKPTWRGAISHRFSDALNVYGSVSRGYKSGAFSLINPYNAPVNPETLTAYEAGFKSDLLERRLRFNASYFHYDYKDLQLYQIVQGQQILLNAAAAKIDGIDADISAVPIEHLTLTTASSYLIRRQYTQFSNAPAEQRNPIPPNCTVGGPCGGNTPTVVDASGNDMIRAPKITASFSANYDVPTSVGAFGFNGTLLYNSGFAWDPSNRTKEPSYYLVNGQISWQAPSEKYRVRFWGKNLFNRVYRSYFTDAITDIASYGPPRTYGLALDVNFF